METNWGTEKSSDINWHHTGLCTHTRAPTPTRRCTYTATPDGTRLRVLQGFQRIRNRPHSAYKRRKNDREGQERKRRNVPTARIWDTSCSHPQDTPIHQVPRLIGQSSGVSNPTAGKSHHGTCWPCSRYLREASKSPGNTLHNELSNQRAMKWKGSCNPKEAEHSNLLWI